MARRSTNAPRSSAKAEQAQSNTVLIVFVVISMLANVGLGIMWYLSQDEIVKANQAKKDADTRAQAAERKRQDIDGFIVTRLRQMIAGNVDEGDLNAMKESTTRVQQEPPEWWPALSSLIEGNTNFPQDDPRRSGIVGPLDPGTGRLANNLVGRVKGLESQLADARKQLKGREEELAKITAEFGEYKKEWNETVLATKLNDAGRRSEADTREKLNQKDLVIKDLQGKIGGLERQVAQMLDEARTTATAEQKKLEDRYEAELAKKERELQDTLQLLDSRKQVQLDKPRGQILRVDPAGDIVYLNLGSDQKLTPGVTFSVHGKGPGGQPLPDPKARIEVLSVLGKGVSMARVRQLAKPEASRPGLTSADDGYWLSDSREFWRTGNPLLPGDLLFNPAWEPNREVHVALAGNFDLDGDGNDDLQAFMNLLRSQGVVIDAYLDPADNFKRKMRLTSRTEYLIVGGVTPTSAAAVEAFQAEAARKGVEILSLPRFLDRIGFSKDRLPVTPFSGGGDVKADREDMGNGNGNGDGMN